MYGKKKVIGYTNENRAHKWGISKGYVLDDFKQAKNLDYVYSIDFLAHHSNGKKIAVQVKGRNEYNMAMLRPTKLVNIFNKMEEGIKHYKLDIDLIYVMIFYSENNHPQMYKREIIKEVKDNGNGKQTYKTYKTSTKK